MKDGDGLLCFNFRADRIRELLMALLDPAFTGFERTVPTLAAAVGMTRYSDELAPLMAAIFPPQLHGRHPGRGGERGRQAAAPHGGDREIPARHLLPERRAGAAVPGEERIMVPSPKVATYDLQPEMSAPELTRRAVEAIGSGSSTWWC